MTLFYKVNRSGKAKVLSPEERTLIQDNLPQKYRLVADLLYWSAGRISEVLAIRVRNLVPETGMVILERGTTKMKRSREVYLPPKLMDSLVLRARGLRLQPNDFLFFNQSPTQSRNGITMPLSSAAFDKELRKVCEWNGLLGVSSHSYRRTQLTELYRDGWTLREIQQISGHRSLASLQEYLDVDRDKVVGKYRKRMGAA